MKKNYEGSEKKQQREWEKVTKGMSGQDGMNLCLTDDIFDLAVPEETLHSFEDEVLLN